MKDETGIYERQGFGQKIGMGDRAALIVVDFVNGFNDANEFGGGNISRAIERTAPLLEACREAGLPIIFTRIVFAEDGSDRNLWSLKVPTIVKLTAGNPASEVVPVLEPRPGERIVDKRTASSFLGTDLASWLAERRVDTLIVTGCTTSGCVRATVVDAIGLGFRPIVVRDCVGDRAIGPHEANLFDMEQKYADVVDRDELLTKLSRSSKKAAASR